MRYSKERKEAVLKKMLPPDNKSIPEIAREEGISEPTRYLWRKATSVRSEGVFTSESGTGTSQGYVNTTQGRWKINLIGSLDSLDWYDGATINPATMTPRMYRHLIMVYITGTATGGGTAGLGYVRIRVQFNQRQGSTSSWYIKPTGWRLYRQWK